MDKIAFTDGEASGILHNLLTDSVDDELWSNSTFTYNDDGYPVKEVNTGLIPLVLLNIFIKIKINID